MVHATCKHCHRRRVEEALDAINTTLLTLTERIHIMATQESIDALTAQVTQLGVDLGAALDGVQADLDALKAANPAVDTTALEASVGQLATAVTRAQSIDAENPVVAPPA